MGGNSQQHNRAREWNNACKSHTHTHTNTHTNTHRKKKHILCARSHKWGADALNKGNLGSSFHCKGSMKQTNNNVNWRRAN